MCTKNRKCSNDSRGSAKYIVVLAILCIGLHLNLTF